MTQEPRLPGAMSQPPEWLMEEAVQPYDLRAFWKPIPSHRNAAPLYLQAMFEFNGEIAACFTGAEAQAMKARVDERSKELSRVFNPATRQLIAGVPPTDVNSLLATYERGFEQILRAQDREECVFEQELTFSANRPHLAANLSFIPVASLRVLWDLRKEEFSRPLEIVDMALRLARDIRNRAPLMDQMSATAVDRLACTLAMDILSAPGITVRHVEQLIEIFKHHEGLALANPLGEAFRAEYVLYRDYLRQLQYRTGAFSAEGFSVTSQNLRTLIKTTGEAIVAANMNSQMWFKTTPLRCMSAAEIDEVLSNFTDDDWRNEVRATVNYYRELLRISELPYSEYKQASERLKASHMEKCIFMSMSAGSGFVGPMAVALAPAHRRGVLCMASTYRRQVNDRFKNHFRISSLFSDLLMPLRPLLWFLRPADAQLELEKACGDAGLLAVPIDPFSNKPMRMVRQFGKNVVYSFGPDCRDDRGLMPWHGMDSPGDILFRIPIRKRH
jgi:hypothetical protein